jgi:ABC-type amino acid transport substrate-binding protein
MLPMPVRSLMLSLLLCAGAVAEAAPPTRVVYPATESRDDSRFDDLKEILRTALDETAADDGPYTLGASSRYVNEARYLAEIRDGGGEANVVWSSTSEQKERELLPIRFELRKGLLGYRVALIDRRRQADFDHVATFADLKKLTMGQGLGWGDVAVYQAAGIRVSTAPYDDLFRMVANGRFDLFPRGVGEAFRERAAHRDEVPDLAVERGLLLYYPWPYYFFCNRADTALAARIERGLARMRADGSFDRIFWKYNRSAIEQARMSERRVIRIPNPLLPKATPLGDAGMWYDPKRDIPPN